MKTMLNFSQGAAQDAAREAGMQHPVLWTDVTPIPGDLVTVRFASSAITFKVKSRQFDFSTDAEGVLYLMLDHANPPVGVYV